MIEVVDEDPVRRIVQECCNRHTAEDFDLAKLEELRIEILQELLALRPAPWRRSRSWWFA